MKITAKSLKDLGCHNSLIYAPWLNLFLPLYEITTEDRVSSFLGNVLHETAHLFYSEEIASGRAYEGRIDLGNTVAGYGVKYKGRGLAQITGYVNYNNFTLYVQSIFKEEKVDFVKNPELVLMPKWAALSAFWFWQRNKLATWADKKKYKEVCAIWNTGRPNRVPNHLKERIEIKVKVEKWFKTLEQ